MKCIIIGAGLAGLTTGAYLSKMGYEVSIYEQFQEIGGVTTTLHKEGYSWDIGPLLLAGFGPNGEATRVLRDLGIYDQLRLFLDDRGLITPDFEFWPPSQDSQPDFYWRKKKLQQLFPAEHESLDRYYKLYLRMLKLVHLSTILPEKTGIQKIFTKLQLLWTVLPLKRMMNWSATEVLDYYFDEPKIKGLLSGILADFVVKPSEYPGIGIPLVNEETAFDKRLPLEPVKNAFQHAFYYIQNGCEQLVTLLADFIKIHGGEIQLNQQVIEILTENQKATGIRLQSNEVVQSDLVISAITAFPTFKKLLPTAALPLEFLHRLNNLKFMESIFMVHLGIDFDPTPYQPKALAYYYRTYDIEKAVDLINKRHYHEGQDGLLIYIPSLHSPAMAPEGKHAVTIYTVAPNRIESPQPSWEEGREEYADKLIKIAEEYIPGLRDHTQTRLIMAPPDFRSRIAVDHHSFGGTAPVMGGENIPFQTPIHNLWFVGCQSESTGGIENVMKGARQLAQKIQIKYSHISKKDA